MGKELFTEELKLAVVQYVLEGHTRREASEKFCVSCTPIEKLVNLYKLHGTKGLLSAMMWADVLVPVVKQNTVAAIVVTALPAYKDVHPAALGRRKPSYPGHTSIS